MSDTAMYDEEDYINPNPLAEHDEWEQTIKDDGTLKPVNERYRIRQSPVAGPMVYCGVCDIMLPPSSWILADLLEVAKTHEAEVHTEPTEEVEE